MSVAAPVTIVLSGSDKTRTVAEMTDSFVLLSTTIPVTLNLLCAWVKMTSAQSKSSSKIFFTFMFFLI